MIVQTWGEVLQNTFQQVTYNTLAVVPNIIVAVLVLIIGWIIGAMLSKAIEQVVKAVRLDSLLRSAGAEKIVTKAGYTLNVGKFLGEVIKWFVIIIALVAALDVLGLQVVTQVLANFVVFYLPQVIAAVIILLVSFVVGDAVKKVVVASSKAANIRVAAFLGKVAQWAIWLFGILAALYQLQIAATFIQTLFTGIVAALTIALGLAFGLGGKEVAAEYLRKVQKELE